jgi:hypothetical protein
MFQRFLNLLAVIIATVSVGHAQALSLEEKAQTAKSAVQQASQATSQSAGGAMDSASQLLEKARRKFDDIVEDAKCKKNPALESMVSEEIMTILIGNLANQRHATAGMTPSQISQLTTVVTSMDSTNNTIGCRVERILR